MWRGEMRKRGEGKKGRRGGGAARDSAARLWSARSCVRSFGVRWPCHRFVFAGHAGGLCTFDAEEAAGMAGEYKAVAWPPHSERRLGRRFGVFSIASP